MKLTQSWVGYLDRSYQQIKASVLARLVVNSPEITDHNESNLLIMIVSMFSGIAEMLNYYIDMMAREGFLGTAQRFTSVIKLAAMIDYNVHARVMASVDELFILTYTDTGLPYYTASFITIPKETIISDINSNNFHTLNDVQIVPGQAGAFSTAQQYDDVLNSGLGNTDGTSMQQVLLPVDYVDASLKLTLDGQPWNLYRSAGLMKANTNGFIVQVQQDGNAYIVFGDGINGLIPTTGQAIVGTYRTCSGASGNLPPNAINQLQGTWVLPNNVSISCINPDYSSGGSDFESMEDVRNKAPRAIRTLERAVTYQDFIDVAILMPGVGDAAVSYCCGKYVSLYVVPSSQGVATAALISNLTDWMNCRKMITTRVSVIAAGISKLFMTATIFGKQLYTENQVLVEVLNLLYNQYGFQFAGINTNISVSDIISLVESAKSVDHIDIASVKVLPYIRPIESNTTPLSTDFSLLATTNTKYTYTIIYKLASNTFKIYRGAAPVGSIGVEQLFNDGIVGFIIHSANYTDDAKWQFVTVPSYPEIFPSTSLVITDYTIPIFDIGPLVNADIPRTIYSNLTVVTQGVNSNCMPPCPQ